MAAEAESVVVVAVSADVVTVTEVVPVDQEALVVEAAHSCPEQAIKIVEETSA